LAVTALLSGLAVQRSACTWSTAANIGGELVAKLDWLEGTVLVQGLTSVAA
jgi:hypothetical protein